MTNYIAYIILNNERTKIEFSTEGNPIEYLWTKYGMDTYIESLEEIKEEGDQMTTVSRGEITITNVNDVKLLISIQPILGLKMEQIDLPQFIHKTINQKIHKIQV